MVSEIQTPVIAGRDLRKTFRRDRKTTARALDGISLEVRPGTLLALVGPDGAGKTTLIRLITGLLQADSGELKVLGLDVPKHAAEIQARVGYMPQKFGLYEDLSVRENLDLYADLHGVPLEQRQDRYARLMEMTALGPFTERLAGKLSGGMKQKLGLACTLVRSPELLVLDEPTVGVDPLSRQELWEIILDLVQNERLTVMLSTAYLDEAARCQEVLVLHEGRVLSFGPPETIIRLATGRSYLAQPPPNRPARLLQAELIDLHAVIDAVPEGGKARFVLNESASAALGDEDQPNEPGSSLQRPDPSMSRLKALLMGGESPVSQKPGAAALPHLVQTQLRQATPRFEDGFMILLRQKVERAPGSGRIALEHPPEPHSGEVAVKVTGLVRRFGSFTAVDHVSFEVRRGEIFGLLGPNGAGKTTTFRMLCGLLPATSGTLEVAGMDLRTSRDSARQHLGYVAQKFSLYGQLSVIENLEFFASAYGLSGEAKRRRVNWAMRQFELDSLARLPSGELPGGFKQRLAMAAALLHEPEILFLDEPTSGADPIARREFWRRITALAEQGVTVIVTTHFMEEAEYCDHIVIQDAGKVLAAGTPAEVRSRARPAPGSDGTMEDAFIAIVQEGRLNPGTDGHKPPP